MGGIERVANDGQKFASELDCRMLLREGVRLAFDARRNVVDEIDFVECRVSRIFPSRKTTIG